ncbi:MAG: hypothetical protein H6566_20180 [Lewinellaceae bacterium]|nr:hypothetical protein [Lewinellaceae bacterium]
MQAAPQWNNLPAGAYTLLVEDAQGCRREFAFLLEDPPPLLLALPADTTLRLGDSLRLYTYQCGGILPCTGSRRIS